MIVKCSRCHHEWQAVRTPGSCDWCGEPGETLALDYVEVGLSIVDMAKIFNERLDAAIAQARARDGWESKERYK